MEIRLAVECAGHLSLCSWEPAHLGLVLLFCGSRCLVLGAGMVLGLCREGLGGAGCAGLWQPCPFS